MYVEYLYVHVHVFSTSCLRDRLNFSFNSLLTGVDIEGNEVEGNNLFK